ncbi:protein N-lysine methyltransferase METTL21D-like [Frankliniella occidentalis]|uniref:Protein N-lysine methyltransferase METTL21D-like n=1 Tax=Frankliniella occidentalis TaxID=133901 RepID=A0A6J1TQJ2_FRAOC|nr:protein N-lysine methyltransferase METTL21D-like [Frankliniella occidentalis]
MSTSADQEISGVFTREFELEGLDKTLLFNQKEWGDVSCVIWDASLVLARYLEKRSKENPSFLKNVKTLELGAGVGCVGIVAACFGANVTVTDLPSVLPLLQLNIKENKNVWASGGGQVRATELSWGKMINELESPDLLLLADCVYYSESIIPLVETMKQISTRETEIIICQEQRDSEKQRAIWKEFMSELTKFFQFNPIPTEEQHPLFKSPDILLLRGGLLP